MRDVTLRLRAVWPFVTFLASAALLAGAHAFETFGGLAPCPLCLDQREWHWGALGVSVLAILIARFFASYAWAGAAALGLVYLGCAWMAFYHVAVEQHWVVAQCGASTDLSHLQPIDFNDRFEIPSCDKPAWTMFGVSMAGYNGAISAALMLASFAIAFWPVRKA